MWFLHFFFFFKKVLEGDCRFSSFGRKHTYRHTLGELARWSLFVSFKFVEKEFLDRIYTGMSAGRGDSPVAVAFFLYAWTTTSCRRMTD